MAANPRTYLKDLVKELKVRWPEHRTINICCHGHSVPAGHFWSPHVDTFNAYPHLLHRGLKERFPWAVINVIVTAFAGENSEKGAARFERDVLNHRPDVVTIDYGLNDRGFSREQTEKYWRSMIDQALARGSKVILLTPTWDVTGLEDPKAVPWIQLGEQTGIIRDLADACEIGLADSYREFELYVRSGGDGGDLISAYNHPNRRGHELVATALLRFFPIMTVDEYDFKWINA